MSFILDALKKSETERQQQSSAEFASVPTSSDTPNPARWLWMLGILLFVNFAVLIGILLKPSSKEETPPATVVNEQAPAPTIPNADPGSFEAQVAEAIDNKAAQPTPAAVSQPRSQQPAPTTTAAAVETPPVSQPATSSSSRVADASIPTMDQLILDGTLQIPQLHLDIHVYSEVPDDRFVFINMNKHNEGSRTAEGPVVREIRTDGVVLEYQGRVFLLPRE